MDFPEFLEHVRAGADALHARLPPREARKGKESKK